MSDLSKYLEPTEFVNSDHIQIGEMLEKLGVIEGDPPVKTAITLFYFVRDKVKYNPYFSILGDKDYIATTILNRQEGYCVQKAIVLAALCRRAQIPCKLGYADIKSHIVPQKLLDLMKTNLFGYHGYCSLYLDGKWVKATPAFDIEMCDKMGYIPVEFDGTRDAVLHPVDRNGNKHIEYVRQIGEYADVPLDDIKKSFFELYVKGNPEIQAFMENAKDDK